MAGPWDKYKAKTEAPISSGTTGPWAKYRKEPVAEPEPVVSQIPKEPTVTPSTGQSYEYMAKETQPDFTDTELQQANAPMLDLTGAPVRPAFGDAPVPIEQSYHEEQVPAQGNLDQAVASIVDEKGDITSNAWDGMNFEQAMAVYEGLLNHPDTKIVDTIFGQVPVFRGHKVPFPEPGFFGSSPSASRISQQGVVDAGFNVAQGIASIADKVAGVAGIESNISENFERPEVKSGSIGDALAHDAVPMIAGGLGGTAASTAVISGASRVLAPAANLVSKVPVVSTLANTAGNLAKGATRIGLAEGGATAALDEDTSGLTSGEDAPLRLDDAENNLIFLDTDDPNMSEGEKTFNQKWNLMIDSTLSGGVIGTAGAGIKKLGSLLHKTYIGGIASSVSEATQKKIVSDSLLHDLTGLDEKATSEARNAAGKELQEALDVGQAHFTELGVEVDPIAAIQKGFELQGKKELATRADTTRNTIYGANMPETTTKQNSYPEVVDRYKENVYQQGGAEGGVEASRSGIVRNAQEEVGESRSALEGASMAEGRASDDLATRIKTDINFGADIDRLSQKTNLNIYEGVNQTSDSIAAQAQKAEKVLSDNRNTAYEKIPNTVKVDEETFAPLVYDEEGEFIKGIPADVQKVITEANGSFKSLHNKLIPLLTKKIAAKNPNSEILQEIKDNILDDQIDILVQKGGAGRGKFKAALENARAVNQDYMDFFGKGAPLYDIRKPNMQRGLIGVNRGNAQEAFRNTRIATTTKVASGNENRERAGTFLELLRKPEVNGDPSDVLKLHIGNAMLDLRPKIQNGDVTDLEVEDFVSSLKDDAAIIQKEFPEQYSQIQSFIDDLGSAKGNIEQLKQVTEKAANEFEAVNDRVGNEIRPFMGAGGIENTEGQQVFEKLFDMPDTLAPLDAALKRAEATGTKGGLEAAFAKKLQGTSSDNYVENEDRIMKVADKLFGKDKPEVIEGIKQAYELERLTHIGKGDKAGIMSNVTNANTRFGQNINKLVTVFFGVLNPTATRVRNLTSVLADTEQPGPALKKIIDSVASNPDDFSKLIKDTTKKNFFNSENKKLISEFMGRVGMFDGLAADKSRDFDQAWEQATLDEGAKKEDKTEEAFGK